jgi:hypothetical protein
MYTEYGVQSNHAGRLRRFCGGSRLFSNGLLGLETGNATINVFEYASKVTSFQPKDVLLRPIAVGYFPLRKPYKLKMLHTPRLSTGIPRLFSLFEDQKAFQYFRVLQPKRTRQ